MITTKQTLVITNLLLLGAVLYYGVEIFYKTLESKIDYVQVSEQTNIPRSVEKTNPAASFNQYNSIVTRDLFGTLKNQAKRPAVVDIEALKPTELNLKLWGTVAGSGGGGAYAVIEDSKIKQQGLYRAGDTVQSATVKAILRGKVILSVAGKDEILQMAEATSQKEPTRPIKRSNRPPQRNNITLQRSFVNDAVTNIGNLLGQVRIRPYFAAGKPAGLSMTGIKPNSIFSKMGLRNGDVLTGVEGKKIQSVNDVIGLYEKLKSSSQVELEVKRRNRPQTITYRIQ